MPVVVYLNGVYWGHYNLRERVDRYFVAGHEGLPLEEADNMDILEAGASRRLIIRFYKLKAEGAKWKWSIYDLDYGLFNSGFNSPYSYLKPRGAGDKLIDHALIRKLPENEQMRHRFLSSLS